MRYQGVFKLLRLLAFPFVFVLTMLWLAPAQAHVQGSSGYTFTLAFGNSGPYVYGSTSPSFRATMVVPQGSPAPNSNDVGLQINGQNFGGSLSGGNNNTYTMYTPLGVNDLKPGNYTAVEVFTPPSAPTIQSNSLTFTVGRAEVTYSCAIQTTGYVFSPGESLQVAMSLSSTNAPIDFQDGTYTLTFKGPTTVTDANLKPDSNDMVTAPAPAQAGQYQLDCAFSGTATIAPPPNYKITATVSLEHQIGLVLVYTSPTTLVSNRPADMYVVFHAAGGLPAPTGRFYISINGTGSMPIYLESDGTVLAHFPNMPYIGGATTFNLFYVGDLNYNSASLTYPITNPPIPGGSGSGSSPKATVTPRPTGTASSATLANAGTPAPGTVASTPTSQVVMLAAGGFPLWILAVLILLVLGGGAGGLLVWRRRIKAPVPAVSYAPESEFTYLQRPPRNE